MAKKRLEILTDVDRTAINKRIDDISTEYVFGFEETFVATANQVEFTLSKEFDKGMQAIELYINGVKQPSSFFTEINNKTIKTKKPIAQGDIVNIRAYKSKKTTEITTTEHKDSHISGDDQLPVATEGTKGLMSPQDKKKLGTIDDKWGKGELEIGGRNLIKNSNKFKRGGSGDGIKPSITSTGLLQVEVAEDSENYHASWYHDRREEYLFLDTVFEEGDWYTVSVTIRGEGDFKGNPTFYVRSDEGHKTLEGTITENWSQISHSRQWVRGNNPDFQFGWKDCVGTFQIKDWKLEKGNISTDWSLAPEDITRGFDNLKQSVSDGKEKVSVAITDKGVETAPDATFDVMANNISKIETDPSIGTTDAVAGDLLEGKKMVSQGELMTGAMPNNGTLSKTLTTQGGKQIITPGYYEGGEVKAQFSNLIASNIKTGVSVGGVVGTVLDASTIKQKSVSKYDSSASVPGTIVGVILTAVYVSLWDGSERGDTSTTYNTGTTGSASAVVSVPSGHVRRYTISYTKTSNSTINISRVLDLDGGSSESGGSINETKCIVLYI